MGLSTTRTKFCDIKWGSERESKIARRVRRVDKIAGALNLQDWYEVPRAKPKGMRAVRYVQSFNVGNVC